MYLSDGENRSKHVPIYMAGFYAWEVCLSLAEARNY
jgi:hypothetical protein